MKILFADDHYLILEGLKDLIINTFPNSEVFLATDKQQLFDLLNHHNIDVLIQDIKFGKDNAKDFLKELQTLHPSTKIIILSSISDPSTIQKLNTKTNGYILKTEPTEIICMGIKKVIEGEQFLSPKAEKITNRIFTFQTETSLTHRELDIVKEIMKEFPTKSIAKNLHISEKTVEMHRANIYSKLEVNNVTGLVKKVIGLGLIDS
ncbi:MAG: LuxR C-terminal-related transcriptional regulator [Crocinitomicaceae bacterium]